MIQEPEARDAAAGLSWFELSHLPKSLVAGCNFLHNLARNEILQSGASKDPSGFVGKIGDTMIVSEDKRVVRGRF